MTDDQMTKLCGDAMGYQSSLRDDGTYGRHWNPLEHDAQAMALVKKLGLTVDPQEDKPPFTWRVVVATDGDWDKQIYSQGEDLNRAIVECAAKLSAQSAAHGEGEKR